MTANHQDDPRPASRQELSGAIAFVGFGEAASALVEGWRSLGPLRASAYDIKTDSADAAVREGKQADYTRFDVDGRATIGEAIGDASVVFSTVTADQALVAAENAAKHLKPGAFFLDCNSCSPGTKRQSAALIGAAGGRYVDVAVMAPVRPSLHKTPMLISGPHAEAALALFAALDMDATLVAGDVGASSSIKMIRSVAMKGLEAVVVECVLAGVKAGVAENVLASLDATYPGFDWRKRSAYMLERVMTHGIRRAAEMREVAATVAELGLGGALSSTASDWQQRVGELGLSAKSIGEGDYALLANAILSALESAAPDRREAAE